MFSLIRCVLLASVPILVYGCGDDGGNVTQTSDTGPQDVLPDVDPEPMDVDADTEDLAPDTADVPDSGVEPGTPVEIDLSSFTEARPEGGAQVSVRQITDESDLVGGPAANGRVGDYLLENGKVRFLVEGANRAIGPCPWGGNVADADIVRADGEPGQDVVGEICLFLYVSQTLHPDNYEILADGSDGGAGVLAVTGHLELNDFVNIVGIASSFIPGLNLDLGFDTESDKPLTLTVYYIMRPGDQGVRVVTALRNDGPETLHIPRLHLLDSGGTVDFFNPLSSRAGFGYDSLGPDSINGEPIPMLGFRGEVASHMYVPEADPTLEADLPIAGGYVAISGVAVSFYGTTDPLRTLLSSASVLPELPELLHLAPGESGQFSHWHLAGDGSLATMVNEVYGNIFDIEIGSIEGVLRDDAGDPIPDALVSAIDSETRTMNQFRTGDDGAFNMLVPPGTYTIRANKDGWPVDSAPEVTVAADGTAEASPTMARPGFVTVTINDPSGSTVPGKIVVTCEGSCPISLTPQDRDVTYDRMISGAAAVRFVGMAAETTIPLAPGDYRVAVSRGFEWSMWPQNANATNGEPVTIVAGETVSLTAEIARVVDSRGAVSGDFHVHSINSPDSTPDLARRVETMLAEGVDVLVSTDHDYITDFGPTIAEMGAEAEITSVIGEEITTFDYSHYNAFPLTHDPAQRNGGALDWAGGDGPGLPPAEIFAWVKDNPGENVAQLNHAVGMFSALQLDPLMGHTFADPSLYRLVPDEPDPVSGDTGLWSTEWTAMELLNGTSRRKFWELAKYWMVFLGRGLHRTGTAVSDTHKRISSQAGECRSFVFVGEDNDDLDSFDPSGMAAAVNAGRVVGSAGPFFVATVSQNDNSATLGETLAVEAGEPVTVTVDIDVPEWMVVNRVHLYANIVDDIIPERPGQVDGTAVPPTVTTEVELTEDDLEVAAQGTLVHRHYVKTVTLEYTPDADSWLVVIVEGVGDVPSMYPVFHGRGERPFAFSNPMFLDADGGGYDNPPLADFEPAFEGPAPTRRVPATPSVVRRILDIAQHRHAHGSH